jgi:hypothetical protein
LISLEIRPLPEDISPIKKTAPGCRFGPRHQGLLPGDVNARAHAWLLPAFKHEIGTWPKPYMEN